MGLFHISNGSVALPTPRDVTASTPCAGAVNILYASLLLCMIALLAAKEGSFVKPDCTAAGERK